MTTATDQAVAAALGISIRHLRELVRAGEQAGIRAPHRTPGRSRLWTGSAETWLDWADDVTKYVVQWQVAPTSGGLAPPAELRLSLR